MKFLICSLLCAFSLSAYSQVGKQADQGQQANFTKKFTVVASQSNYKDTALNSLCDQEGSLGLPATIGEITTYVQIVRAYSFCLGNEAAVTLNKIWSEILSTTREEIPVPVKYDLNKL